MKDYETIRYSVADDSLTGYLYNGIHSSRIKAIASYCYNHQWGLLDQYPDLRGYKALQDGHTIPLAKFEQLTGMRQDFWKFAQSHYGAKSVPVTLLWRA